MGTIRIEGIEEPDLRRMYDVESMTQDEIADQYGVGHTTIANRMREYGIERRRKGEDRMYSINQNFFKAWVPESVWLYGWAIGDGSFTGISELKFGISHIDREVLFKFKEVLDSEHPIYDYIERGYKLSCVRFFSRTIVNDLKQVLYYDVPLEYFNHFLRGFFEAEGCVFWSKNKELLRGGSIALTFTQNDYEILDYIRRVLQNKRIVKGGGIYRNENTWKLHFSVLDTIPLYRFMYNDCKSMFLKRKKEKFEYLISKNNMRTNRGL